MYRCLFMVYDFCKKCGEKRNLKSGLCEDCQSVKDAERMSHIYGVRERQTKEDIEKEVAEKKHDKRFWWGTKDK